MTKSLSSCAKPRGTSTPCKKSGSQTEAIKRQVIDEVNRGDALEVGCGSRLRQGRRDPASMERGATAMQFLERHLAPLDCSRHVRLRGIEGRYLSASRESNEVNSVPRSRASLCATRSEFSSWHYRIVLATTGNRASSPAPGVVDEGVVLGDLVEDAVASTSTRETAVARSESRSYRL